MLGRGGVLSVLSQGLLGRRGDKVAMHWWYYPDSYDELVVADEAPEVVEPDKQAEGAPEMH